MKYSRRFLTVGEAAEKLVVSDSTVRRWAGYGYLPGTVRIGKVLRIPERALNALARGDGIVDPTHHQVKTPLKPTLTLPEVAQRWRVSVSTVRRLIPHYLRPVTIRLNTRIPTIQVQRYERERLVPDSFPQ